MKRLPWLSLLLVLVACGGDSTSDSNVECAVSATERTFCVGEKSFLCPIGSAEDVATNEAIDKACEASAGNNTDALAKCSLDAASSGKYKMKPGLLAEDCAASGKLCGWVDGTCVAKP
jgi:hypothetical protein